MAKHEATNPLTKPVSKLVSKVPPFPGVPGASRRQQYSATTKHALIEVAKALFSAQGYANTSLDAITSGAEVTKGALYHHFSGKQALFEAVFEQVETVTARTVTQAMKAQKDPWEKALTGLNKFLDAVREPSYRRIVIQDGPAVLGYERYREQEGRTAFAVVHDIVELVIAAAGSEVDEEMVATYARLFFGALSSAGEAVATAEDPEAQAQLVESAAGFIFAGLQALAAQGVDLSGPSPMDAAATRVTGS